MDVDPVFELFIPAAERPDVAEVPDVVEELFTAAKLASHVGWRATENLARETENLDKAADRILRHSTAAPAAVIEPDSHELAKLEGSGTRRKRNLAVWMNGQLALGKTCRELIEHAAQHDQDTANLLSQIAAELGEA